MISRRIRQVLPLAAALVLPCIAAAQTPPWMDTSQTADVRAKAAVDAMTLDEKLKLFDGDMKLDFSGATLNRCVGHIPAIPRLGLPELCMGDGPAGVANSLPDVTVFPAPMMGAASWNPELMRHYGEALGAEHAGKGHNVVLAPTINIARSARWGRNAETLSEDPLLTSAIGDAIIEGIQTHPVMADAKHFVAYNQETDRFGVAPEYSAVNVDVSQRALHEIYYPAFRSAVQDAGVGSVMCAYNSVNNAHACENDDTLADLRGWGFKGLVMSDWYFGQRSLLKSVNAGLDVSMPGGTSPYGFEDFYGAPLAVAVKDGRVTMQQIDAMALHVLEPMFRLGLVDHPLKADPTADVRSPAHTALAREIAEKGIVLLKNDSHVLPLSALHKSIAVIGDDAGADVSATELYGGFVNYAGMKIVTPLDALRARAPAGTRLIHAQGTAGIGELPLASAKALGVGAWTARYYNNGRLLGTPAITRSEAVVDSLKQAPEGLGLPWSARYTTTFTAPKDGLYRFSLTGGGHIQMFVDGTPIATLLDQNFMATAHGAVALKAGRPVQLRVDFSNATAIIPIGVRVGWEPAGDSKIDAAVAAARKADVALVFAGDMASEGADRPTTALPGDQDALIAAVAAANPRTVVVLNTVGAVRMPWLDKVAAVVQAWYPGEQAGNAIAAVLYGDVDPSGRLPVSFPRGDDHPILNRARYPGVNLEASYADGLLVGYRAYNASGDTPLFPFGFGLSYTHFALSGFGLARTDGPGVPSAHVRVANTGRRSGTETVQLYLTYPEQAGEPPRQLVGFAQVTLAPGESREVQIPVATDAGQVWDEKSASWLRPAGDYRLELGTSSADMVDGKRFHLD